MVGVTSGFGGLGLGLQPYLKIFSASVSLMCTLVLSVASSTQIRFTSIYQIRTYYIATYVHTYICRYIIYVSIHACA